MARTAEHEFEVWGQPVRHSLSPALHRAAYKVLGLEWSYQYRDVSEESLASVFSNVGDTLGGVSLTMPLKQAILGLVAQRDPIVDTLRAANTVYRHGSRMTLSNTDAWGFEQALDRHNIRAPHAWILGAGATARAVGYALSRRGTGDVALCVRNPERAQETADVLRGYGVSVSTHQLGETGGLELPQLVVSTLPGGVTEVPGISSDLVGSAALCDVAYAPWPSHLATQWNGSPHPVMSGLWMLAYQAVAQIRLFLHQSVDTPLPQEEEVFSAMITAVGLDSGS
jgi:shikimate dehydrogenase